jgi:acyl-CoA reductase-like NAD-dependent aldehyde dehydrogenase
MSNVSKEGASDTELMTKNDQDISLISPSQSTISSILNKINAGSGYWNCCDRVSAALPWSGRKNSGFGSSLSGVGIRAFTKPKGLHLRNI